MQEHIRLSNMIKNNKGLSLIELIVAFAIFAIAGVAVCSFMIFGTKQFNNSTKSVKLQYEQQLVVNRIRDIILETSKGVSYDEATGQLLVFSDNSDDGAKAPADPSATPEPSGAGESKVSQCLVTQISFKLAEDGDNHPGYLYVSKPKAITIDEDTDVTSIKSGDFGTPIEISDAISEFKVVDFAENLKKNKVELKIVFKVENKEIEVNPVITLRNLLTNVNDGTDLNDIYMPSNAELDFFSPVAKVEISRDGKVFAQSKTDTIKMAGDGETTTVDYDAIVTKKKTYKEPLSDATVTWSLDESTLVKPGYENCISLSGDGIITLKKYIAEDGTVYKPNDYINGGYFVLVATSKADPSKSARLRIKVDVGGVYPKTITFENPVKTQDKISGLGIYTFSNIIEYTGLIEDPANPGSYVNPLIGDGVYTKITYKVNPQKGSVPPTGAGFSTTKVDGTFIVTKEMIGKSYTIVATVSQRDQNGEVVEAEYTFTVDKNDVPVVDDTITVPILNCQETALRGAYSEMSVRWSLGAPTYIDNKQKKVYDYRFEWDLEPVESNWSDAKLNKFSTMVYFENNGTKSQHLYKSWDNSRIALVNIAPELNWEKAFIYRVNLRAHLVINGNDMGYYRLPGSDPADANNYLTSEKESAYVVSQLVKIDPVTLKLTPIEGALYESNNSQANMKEGSYGIDTTIYLSEPYTVIKYENGVKKEVKIQATRYYKLFKPEFTGISVTALNYKNNIKGIKNMLSDDKTASLQIYTNYPSGTVYRNGRVGNEYSWEYDYYNNVTIAEGHGNTLYVCLSMMPSKWASDETGAKPHGAKWVCVIEDKEGNSVRAKFAPDNADSMNYKFIYENKK